jgi:hypothetical protein
MGWFIVDLSCLRLWESAQCAKRKSRAARYDLNEVMFGSPAVSEAIRSVAFRLPVARDLALEIGAFGGRQMRRPNSFT